MRPFCASENEPRDMLTKYVGSEHWGWRQDERTTAKGAGDGSEPFFIFGCCCPLCSRQSHCLHQIFVFSRSGNSNGAQPFSPLSDPMIFFSYNAFDVFHCMRVCIHVYRSRCRWRTPLRCAHGMNLFHNWIHFNVNIIFFSPAPQSLALLSLMFCCCCGNEGSRLHATPGYCECLWNMNDQEKVRVFRFGRFRCLHSQAHACWVARLLSVDDVKLLSVLCVMGFQCKWEQQRQKVEHCMHIILTGEGTSDCRKGRIIFMILFSPFEMRLFCCYNDKNRTSRSLTHSVCSLPTSHSIDDGKEQQLAQSST